MVLNLSLVGGNSVWSEVMSYEILHANYGAKLLRTEMEIEYWPASKITDYSITVMVRVPRNNCKLEANIRTRDDT